MINPLLRVLSVAPDGLPPLDAYERVADAVGLSAEDRSQRLPSTRVLRYRNRIGWANHCLKAAGLTEAGQKGAWCLTARGRDWMATHPDGADEGEIRRILRAGANPRESPAVEPAPAIVRVRDPDQQRSPDERLEEAARELNDGVAAELLDRLRTGDPDFFERVVLDVLLALGYGATRESLEQTGGTGDGGIDGIITLDRLGLEKVYVQAKRWSTTVGRPDIQGFYGALAGRRASRGVFITSSSFSREAVEFSRSVSDSLVLVDGERLAELMIDCGVGVSVARTIKIVKVDSDYFEEA